MSSGGKYDAECEAMCLAMDADATLLIVFGGKRGSGFSVTVRADRVAAIDLPQILRNVATSIETQVAAAPAPAGPVAEA